MTGGDAIEVFATGFARVRSLVSGCVAERFGACWVIHDEPRRGRKERVSEVCGWEVSVGEVMEAGSALGGPRWCASVALETLGDKGIPEYKSAGFRRVIKEGFFAADLAGLDVATDADVIRIRTPEDAEQLRVARGGKIGLRPQDLESVDPEIRCYALVVEGHYAARVASYRVGNCSWVSDLHVDAAYRRRGFATRLMRSMLADDLEFGVRTSVLLASSDGEKLYPGLGYERLGTLQVMRPPGYIAGRED